MTGPTHEHLTQESSTPSCASCGARLSGNWCAMCGEQRLRPNSRSLVAIASDIFQEFTSLDSRVIKTVILLAMHPGQYERNVHEGRRVAYIKPLTLFLLVNVFFVTLTPITDFFVTFQDQLAYQFYSDWVTPWLVAYVDNTGLSLNEFAQRYDQIVTVTARSLIILQVAVFALLVGGCVYHQDYDAGDYFVFSLNTHSWLLTWIIVAQLPALAFSSVIALFIEDGSAQRMAYLPLLIGGFLLYIAIAAKVMFVLDWKALLLRLPLLLIALPISHFTYRLLQLIITTAMVTT